MGARWFWGIIILAAVSLLSAWFLCTPNTPNLEKDIRRTLQAAGYNVNVEMQGHVAILTGVLESNAAIKHAVTLAENATCEDCGSDRRRHVVESQLTSEYLPIQTPYIFNANKDADGIVRLSGYVESDASREEILAKARALFQSALSDENIEIANGSPDANWANVIESNITELARLKTGRVAMENKLAFISGEAKSVDVRRDINALSKVIPAGYEYATNISVADMAPENVGTLQSKPICQTLFNDLRDGQEIEFSTNKAVVRGKQSFNLLNSLASAAKQCVSFHISVDGHTDNVGTADYNLWLSDARANTVAAYLVENGIASSRLKVRGYGETKPRESNDTDEGQAANRRIEFTINQAD